MLLVDFPWHFSVGKMWHTVEARKLWTSFFRMDYYPHNRPGTTRTWAWMIWMGNDGYG